MNKIYKVIWSKAKNCYVVASELAKNHTKSPKSGVIGRTLVAGVLACVLSCGIVSFAEATDFDKGNYRVYPIFDVSTSDESGNVTYYYGLAVDKTTGQVYTAKYADWWDSLSITSGSMGTLGGSTSYSAGNGLVLSGTTFAVKAGTGITVNSNGVSITSGSVSSGNANAITGGTAYNELRPANGTFVKQNQTTAQNLTALDTASKNAIKGLSTNGSVLTYTKGDGTAGMISTSAKYVGINSSGGINQTGEGAVASDSIAIGKNAKAIKDSSVAIGLDSYADEENTISVGHRKTLINSDGVPIDPDTNQPYSDPSSVTIFDSALNRRITNVADGIRTNDAVNVGQLMSIQGGTVAQNNAKLISGGTAFSELRPADGQFIRRANTTAQNLTALDNMGKNAVKSMTIDGNMLVYTRGDNTSVSLDLPSGGSGSGSGTSRFTGEGVTTTVGSVTAFASNSTPTGYLLCDGRAVSRTKYANLFKKIGTTYGAGDGKTTFNLPNLVNRFVEGSNASGQYINAGLPNVTGSFNTSQQSQGYSHTTGAFRHDEWIGIGDEGEISSETERISFDASRSSSIYGKSNTVQPEALKMQYYIKTDDEFNGSRYMGVNTNSGYYNEFGEGAVGTDATAIGRNVSAKGDASVALGRDAVASGAGVVSVGHASTDINPATNKAYGSELNRKIVNVADGSSSHDAATFGQMTEADNALSARIGKVNSDKHFIKKSDTNSVSKNLIVLDNALNDEVANRINAISREANLRTIADNELGERIGTLSSDGNYIHEEYNVSQNLSVLDSKIGTPDSANGNYTNGINTVNENIKVLDTQIKALSDSMEDMNDDIQDELDTKANVDASNVTDAQAWADKIGTGSVSSTDTKLVTGTAVARETRVNSDGAYVSVNNTAGQNISVLDLQVKANADAINDLKNDTTDALDTKANVDLDNITPEGETVIRNLAKGSVKVINGISTTVTKGMDGDAVTYAVNVVKDGIVKRNNTGVVTGDTVYNAIRDAIDDLQEGTDAGLDTKANVDASNVSSYANEWGQAIGKGTVTDNDNKLVTGNTLFDEVRPDDGNYVSKDNTTAENLGNLDTQVKANTDAIDGLQNDVTDMLDNKANADASNVRQYTSQWGEAIGTGSVMNNDKELVTGGTMYDELRPDNGNYISKSNTTAENLGNLDTQVKVNTDAIADLQDNVSDITDTKANKDLDNITPAGEGVVRELAKGSVKVVNGRYTTVTEGTEGNAKTYAVNVTADGVVEDNNEGLVTGGTVKEAIDNLSGVTDDKLLDYAKKDASNITDTQTWGETIGTGQVADNNKELVTGGTVYTAIDTAVNTINDSLDDKANTSLDNLTPDGEMVIRELAKGSVKVINGISTTVTEGTEGNIKTYAVNVVKDGIVEDGNEGLVTGSTVKEAIDTLSDSTDTKLEEYAKKDASNIADTEAWGTVIGTGTVEEGNKELVTGGTVHTAITDAVNGINDTFNTTLEGYAKKDASNVDPQIWGEKLGNGTVDAVDDKLVSGKTVFAETRVNEDGNYVKKDNTAGQNLSELDRILKETRDIAENAATQGTDDNAVHYDNRDKSVITLEGTDGTVITNLKDGELSADSKDAVTGKQLFETNEKVKNNTEAIQTIRDSLGTVEDGSYVSKDKTFGENIGALDTQLKTVSDGLDTVRNDVNTLRETVTETINGKADTDLGNITDDGKDVIANIAKGSVKVKGSGIATVTESEEGQATVYTVDVQADGVVEEGNTNAVSGGTVYNTVQEIRNDMNEELNKKADTDLSNLTDTGKEVIRETLRTDLDSKADKVDLDSKANVDASNIDVRTWQETLGTGSIAPGDTGLINGDTAYRAVQYIRDNEVVKADFENGVIGVANDPKYDGIDLINVSKSDGSSRIMTGIATDPKDPSSASNVAYVNAVGQLVMDNMNDRFTRVDDKMGKVGANAAAMASLEAPPMDGDEKWAFSAAIGHYDGKTAGAVGAFYRPQDNVLINVRGAVGNGEDMIGAGVGIALERSNSIGITKAKLAKAVNEQATVIEELKAERQADKAEIEELKAERQSDKAEIAQLKVAVQQLLANQNK